MLRVPPSLMTLKILYIPPQLEMGSFSQDKWPKLNLIHHNFAGPFLVFLYVFLPLFITSRRFCFGPISLVSTLFLLKFDALFDREHILSIQRLDLRFGQFELI